jgi:hypothetical protein
VLRVRILVAVTDVLKDNLLLGSFEADGDSPIAGWTRHESVRRPVVRWLKRETFEKSFRDKLQDKVASVRACVRASDITHPLRRL